MNNTLALDVGEQRVGLALARSDVKIAHPLTTLARQAEDFWESLVEIIAQQEVGQLVIGLPRGLDGQETAQTLAAKEFGKELTFKTTVPILWQDEALTSVKAESMLRAEGKPYNKGDIDALAASLILTDYLETR